MSWKTRLSQETRISVDAQIRETLKEKKAYKQADDPTVAQLWVAIANLANEMKELRKQEPQKRKKVSKEHKKELLESLENL